MITVSIPTIKKIISNNSKQENCAAMAVKQFKLLLVLLSLLSVSAANATHGEEQGCNQMTDMLDGEENLCIQQDEFIVKSTNEDFEEIGSNDNMENNDEEHPRRIMNHKRCASTCNGNCSKTPKYCDAECKATKNQVNEKNKDTVCCKAEKPSISIEKNCKMSQSSMESKKIDQNAKKTESSVNAEKATKQRSKRQVKNGKEVQGKGKNSKSSKKSNSSKKNKKN